jgi:hypothetical protein
MAVPDQGRRVVVVAAVGVAVVVAVGLAVPVARGLLEDEPVAPAAPATTWGGGPWERLPRPPANDVLRGPDPAGTVWTGEELILLGSSAFSPPTAMRPPEALAYDPAADGWAPGRAWPLTAWTGDRAIFIGGADLGDRPRVDRGSIADITEQGAAYHPR